MRGMTWTLLALAATLGLALAHPAQAAPQPPKTTAAKPQPVPPAARPAPGVEWVDLIGLNTGDPLCGYGIALPLLPYLPANLPPEKRDLARRIAADAGKDIEALKKDIMAKTLEWSAAAKHGMQATREEITGMAREIADMYGELRGKYHAFVRRMETEVGATPLFRHAAPAGRDNNGQQGWHISYVPYTPLYWDTIILDTPATQPGAAGTSGKDSRKGNGRPDGKTERRPDQAQPQ